MKRTYHKRGETVDGYKVRSHPSYYAWSNMKSRCSDPNNKAYVNYGGRGIGYADEWDHFKNFADDMGIKPSPDHTLERIDNEKGYCKENCVWADRHTQAMNRRTFKNNTTGYRGVKRVGNRFTATVNFKGERFKIGGTFETDNDAYDARCDLLTQLKAGNDVSHLLERPARYDSSVGIKGISRHHDGGYMVRVTDRGERKYLGYFKTLDEAKERLEKWQNEKN